MFDIAFSELLAIAIVALIVIGPEKLPKVARTLGLLTGRVQRYVNSVKADIKREMQFEDLQELQQEIRQGSNRIQTQLQDAQNHVADEMRSVEDGISQNADDVVQPAKKPADLPDERQ